MKPTYKVDTKKLEKSLRRKLKDIAFSTIRNPTQDQITLYRLNSQLDRGEILIENPIESLPFPSAEQLIKEYYSDHDCHGREKGISRYSFRFKGIEWLFTQRTGTAQGILFTGDHLWSSRGRWSCEPLGGYFSEGTRILTNW